MKKKLLLVYLMSLFTTVLISAQQYMKVTNVQTSLNIRSESNTDCEIVGKLTNGEIVEFISEMDPEEQHDRGECWIHIRKDNIDGWVMCNYVEMTDEKPKEVQSESFFNWLTQSLKSIWNWYVKLFWSTNGDLGLILAIIGTIIIVILFLAVIFIGFIGFGIFLHGLLGFIFAVILFCIPYNLDWITMDTYGYIFVSGFFLGIGWGIFRLIKDRYGFLEIYDGFCSEGSHICGHCNFYSDGYCTYTYPAKPRQYYDNGCDYYEFTTEKK